jgi:hypothetical protein
MQNRFSPQFSDEDLDLYLVGKADQDLTATIEAHYFGASAASSQSGARRSEAIVIAVSLVALIPLATLRMNQQPQAQTIASAIVNPALPLASAIVAASIDLYAPAMLSVARPPVQPPPAVEPIELKVFQPPPQKPRSIVHIAMVDPPAVAFHSKVIPAAPIESEVPPIAEPQKQHRLRRFFSGVIAPLKVILSLDRYNHGA